MAPTRESTQSGARVRRLPSKLDFKKGHVAVKEIDPALSLTELFSWHSTGRCYHYAPGPSINTHTHTHTVFQSTSCCPQVTVVHLQQVCSEPRTSHFFKCSESELVWTFSRQRSTCVPHYVNGHNSPWSGRYNWTEQLLDNMREKKKKIPSRFSMSRTHRCLSSIWLTSAPDTNISTATGRIALELLVHHRRTPTPLWHARHPLVSVCKAQHVVTMKWQFGWIKAQKCLVRFIKSSLTHTRC